MNEKLNIKNLNETSIPPRLKNSSEFIQIASNTIEKTDGEVTYFFNSLGESFYNTYGMYYVGMPPTDGNYGGLKITKEEYEKQLSNVSEKLYSNYLKTLSIDEPSVEGFKDFTSKL